MTHEENLSRATQRKHCFTKMEVFAMVGDMLRKDMENMQMVKLIRDSVSGRPEGDPSGVIREIDQVFPQMELQMKAMESALIDFTAWVDEERIVAARAAMA